MTARNRRRCFRTMATINITNDFDSFCRRMWLDYCDEHGTVFGGVPLSEKEYTSKYNEFLMEKYGASKE
jgi:hypothetical protein|tara:strand:- start:165 stop:371 length:207 start_codon:yes stop_codon:yes gene_type:complete